MTLPVLRTLTRRLRSGTSICKVRVVLALVAIVAASGASPAAQTAAELEAAVAQTASLNALRVWLDAVTLHRPGEADLPAAVVASSSDELEQLLPALVHYLDYARTTEIARQKAGQRGVNVAGTAGCQPCGASSRERQRLLRETRSRAPVPERFPALPLPGTLNDLIIRGVMLHSDAAVRLRPGPQVPRTINTFNVLKLPSEVLQSHDGQFAGTTPPVGHWYMTRALLNFMTPEPSLAPLARQWYHWATAYFAATSNFAGLAPHLAAAQALFPDDATLAFDLGWQSELAATPLVQHDVSALVAQATAEWKKYRISQARVRACDLVPCDKDRNPFGIKSERDSLADAEQHLSRAITLDPTMTEAYVRLAHVRTLRGRAADAQTLFMRLPPSADVRITFYAAMVEGKTLEALGRLDDAAAAYQRAGDLFPDAHSVNIALSAVEQRRGDVTRAAAYAQRAVDPPAGEDPPTDPMVTYGFGRGPHVTAAWSTLIAALEASR
jgi:hypothetical protein